MSKLSKPAIIAITSTLGVAATAGVVVPVGVVLSSQQKQSALLSAPSNSVNVV